MSANKIEVCKVRLAQVQAPLPDIRQKIREEYEALRPAVKPGMEIAVAVGSRGISNLGEIVRAVVDCLRESGARPFLFPAMGSHGGATAEGQRQVLANYGITEEAMGVPVRSSMETVLLGRTGTDPSLPVYLDRNAAQADKILVINRVKPHTDFHGPHESGIIKMLVIGIGKQDQAAAVHQYGTQGLRDLIPEVAKRVLESGRVLGALAILEDGLDQTAGLKFAGPGEIFQVDAEFLTRSRRMMARLPFERVDALVVDRMGKDISGTGMDTNVIGRLCIRGQRDAPPDCRRIAVLDLTEASHGNALGVGLADVTTRRLEQKVDWNATNENVITSGFLERGFLPLVARTDREAVEIAAGSCCVRPLEVVRLARIHDTLHLREAYLSRVLWEEVRDNGAAERLSGFAPITFGADGAIGPF